MTRHRASPGDSPGDSAAAGAELDAIYAAVPTVNCKGLCQYSCGSVAMIEIERERIADRHGRIIPDGAFALDDRKHCPALAPDGQCGVYDDRPFICRLWGTTRSMRCRHGCMPASGFTPEPVAQRLLFRLFQLGPLQFGRRERTGGTRPRSPR